MSCTHGRFFVARFFGARFFVTRFFVTMLLVLCGAMPTHEALAQAGNQRDEYRVKAAFLYKIGGFIEWPGNAFPDAGSAIFIGVIGADVLATELEQLVAGRTIAGRPVSVRKLRGTRAESGSTLHVLFIGRSEARRVGDILDIFSGPGVLTVTESEDALGLGSMINFVVIDDKVRFDVAVPPADAANVKISSRLLVVARKVVGRTL
jgi:hypothetical protein